MTMIEDKRGISCDQTFNNPFYKRLKLFQHIAELTITDAIKGSSK